eukprot:10219472-Alexandrium_andersonii.AAC.1
MLRTRALIYQSATRAKQIATLDVQMCSGGPVRSSWGAAPAAQSLPKAQELDKSTATARSGYQASGRRQAVGARPGPRTLRRSSSQPRGGGPMRVSQRPRQEL